MHTLPSGARKGRGRSKLVNRFIITVHTCMNTREVLLETNSALKVQSLITVEIPDDDGDGRVDATRKLMLEKAESKVRSVFLCCCCSFPALL